MWPIWLRGGGMFGQDDNQQHGGQDWQQPGDQPQVVQPAQSEEVVHDGSLEAPAVEATPAPVAPNPDPIAPAQDWQQPAAQANPAPTEWSAPAAAEPVAEPTNAPADDASSDLLDIKQQALTQLSPLVGHLDQSPEEKFKTTMMMIQASDNQALIPEAYTAAQAITDEKAKAQALLDIVNEINYFTQHQQS